MQAQYIGCYRRNGKSKKNGKNYDMAFVMYLDDVKPYSNEESNYQGFGKKASEFPLDARMIDNFKNLKPFTVIDLLLQPNPYNPRENICVGYKPLAAA